MNKSTSFDSVFKNHMLKDLETERYAVRILCEDGGCILRSVIILNSECRITFQSVARVGVVLCSRLYECNLRRKRL